MSSSGPIPTARTWKGAHSPAAASPRLLAFNVCLMGHPPTHESVACVSCCTTTCWRGSSGNSARQTPSPCSTCSWSARSLYLSSCRSGRAQKCPCPHAVAGTGKVGVGWVQVCRGGPVRLGDGAPPGDGASGPRRRPPPHQRLLPTGAHLVPQSLRSRIQHGVCQKKLNGKASERRGRERVRRLQHLSVQSLECALKGRPAASGYSGETPLQVMKAISMSDLPGWCACSCEDKAL